MGTTLPQGDIKDYVASHSSGLHFLSELYEIWRTSSLTLSCTLDTFAMHKLASGNIVG